MSEHKQEKWLYTFSIPKTIEVEKLVEEEIEGQQVKVQRKVQEKQDFRFALKRPNRRMFENADIFYGVSLAEGIRAGLLTKALLLKRYRDDGGALSEGDTQYFNQLVEDLSILEKDHQRFILNLDKLPEEENNTRVKDTFNKKIEVLQKLQAFETINRALFSHTAEAKADVQLTNWWTVHLAYWDEKSDGNFTEFFPGTGYEQKMQHWDKLYETDEPFLLESLARFALLIGLWTAGAQNSQDFENGEKFQVSAEETQKKTEEPTAVSK
jgi:hypothetical protein